jgi:hypothetical protein
MDGGGKRVIEEGLGGKTAEVLAGGGLGSLPVRVGDGGGRNFKSRPVVYGPSWFRIIPRSGWNRELDKSPATTTNKI